MTHRTPLRALALVALVVPASVGCKTTPSEPSSTATSASAATSAAPVRSTPANALPIPSGSVASEVNRDNLPAYDGPTGSVEGTIYVTGDPSPPMPPQDFSKCPDAAGEYGKLFRDGPPLADGRRPVADAVVAVIGYSGFYVPEQKDARTIAFEGCGYPTRTITMTFGQRLDIVNKSKLLFAPELAEAPGPAVLIPPPQQAGDPVHLYPPHPGSYVLHDKVNSLPYLRAQVIVMRQPLHAETDSSGHYRIDGVPVGKQLSVNAELPLISARASQKVDIVAGVVAKVDLVFDYKAPAPPVSSTPAPAPVR